MKNPQKNDSRKKERQIIAQGASKSPTALPKKQLPKKVSAQKQSDTNPPKRKIIAVSPTSNVKRNDSKNNQFKSPHNSKDTAGSSTATRSSKVVQQSLRSSPKLSLSEINAMQIKKSFQDTKKRLNCQQIDKSAKKRQIQTSNKVKEQVKKSLANVIKNYHPDKKQQLDISMTEVAKDAQLKSQKLTRAEFNFLSVIGEGGYGKVWKIEHLKTRMTYAMKEMSKALIMMKKSVDNVLNEMRILTRLKSPFIANMVCAFNDRDNLYLGMDYLPGGDLRSFLGDCSRLKEHQVKFFIACIIKALEYVHDQNIFHRDIKPENLVLDDKGYLRLTDFGIARSLKDKQCLDASGTPGYMAPEVICKQLHSYSVDFYAIGIICYELVTGKRPYYGQNRAEIRDAIISKQHCLAKKDLPAGWSAEATDFINKLIQRQPTSRLGHRQGVKELINHPWLAKFSWKQLSEKKLISPFKLSYKVPTITDRIGQYEQAVNQYKILQRTDQKLDVFSGYYSNLAAPEAHDPKSSNHASNIHSTSASVKSKNKYAENSKIDAQFNNSAQITPASKETGTPKEIGYEGKLKKDYRPIKPYATFHSKDSNAQRKNNLKR